MKVKCLTETINPGVHNKKLVEWAKKSELEITLGKTYTVIAISKYLDFIFYYILGDETDNYPLAFPSECFEIIDSSVSKFWNIDLVKIETLNELNIEEGQIISFKEWVLKQDEFYENLLEEKKSEIEIFNNYRNKMLVE
jgi:hypothetical protein